MFMPQDRLFSRLEMPKSIFQNDEVNVMEAQLPDHYLPYCIIEYYVTSENFVLSLSKLLPQYKNLSHPNILKVHYWTYDMVWSKGIEKQYKIYFIIDHFDFDLREQLILRQKKERNLFERDMYRLTKELSEALQEAQKANVPLSPIVAENFVSSNGKLKYIPYVFLSEAFSKRSKKFYPSFNPNTVTSINSLLPPLKLKPSVSDSSREYKPIKSQKNLLMTSSLQSPRSLNTPKSPVIASLISPKKVLNKSGEFLGSISPLNINPPKRRPLYEFETISTKVLYEEAFREQEVRKRIHNLAVVLAMIAENYTLDTDEDTILTPIRIESIATKYGREYADLLRAMSHSDIRKRPKYDHIIYIVLMIIKNKGSEDQYTVEQPGSLTSLMKPISYYQTDENYKYMMFFPELYQKLIVINIHLDKNKIFSELVELNLDFIIPNEHRSLSICTKESQNVFLFGGRNSNESYRYKSDSKVIERIAPMLANFERRAFGCCLFSNSVILVAGGYFDTDITGCCEIYDIENDAWAKIREMNVPSTDICLCPFGDQFIFKFGGMLSSQNLCQTIERYDKVLDDWMVIKYNIPESSLHTFSLLRNSVAIPLDDKSILVCGGINIYYEGSNQTFVFRMEQCKDDDDLPEKKKKVLRFRSGPNYNYKITDFNAFTLPNKDSLEQIRPISMGGEFFIISQKKTAHRKLLNFSKNSWKEIKDVKW